MRLSLAAAVAALVLVPAAAQAGTPAITTHGPDPIAPLAQRFRSDGAPKDRGPWCGRRLSRDDTAHQVDNGAPRFHAILAVPAGAKSRLTELAPDIQGDALGSSALLERRYGRAFRFDMGTSCGPQYLDISILRMRRDAAALRDAATRPNGTLDAIYDELRMAGWPVTLPQDDDAPLRPSNYVVWLDGPATPDACGQATLYGDPRRTADNRNNMGGSVAVVFRAADGFCGADAVRHEIGHTLGAVLPGVAPHADGGGHCTDAVEDTLCLTSAPVRATGLVEGEFFDYNNDDYWDPPLGPPLPWWTVNLSRFLCPKPDCNSVTPSRSRPRRAVRARRSRARAA